MRFEGKTVLAIHEGQTDTAMVRGQQVAKRAALRLGVCGYLEKVVPYVLSHSNAWRSACRPRRDR